ncbi:VRR-NUC domain-containing protein, partial [Iodobacter sp. CM08]|uniref:VRR-NUC domain-containing protein n=1 Tax=Iodobacter sp. CM08 TaxID=3085902 RepID=UPI0029819393
MTKTIRLEEDTSKGLALLPSPQNKIYLHPKATQASLFPQIRIAVSKKGKTYEVQARQVVMSASISTDEKLHDYFWYYKAEVNFEIPNDENAVPRPFLSSTAPLGGDGKKDPNRRHAVTPFPVGKRTGFLRRPDLIIVKDKTIRWPARAVTDHEGVFHADNLLRVVEIKFPGDSMDEEQEAAYTHIAGGKKHFTLLNVIEEDKPKKQPVQQPAHQPVFKRENKSVTERQRALIYGPSHLPDPAFYEPWLADAKRSINDLLDDGEKELVYLRSGLKQLSQEVEGLLRQNAQWMFSAGHWVRNSASHAW